MAAADPAELGRAALREGGLSPQGWTLVVSTAAGRNVARLGFERLGRGLPGAWYLAHHQLAALLSREQAAAVHVYALVPFEVEEVVTYGGGQRVGGERVDLGSLELDDDALDDDAGFARAQERWPLGHLAQVLGVTRDELLGLGRARDAVRRPLSRGPRRRSA